MNAKSGIFATAGLVQQVHNNSEGTADPRHRPDEGVPRNGRAQTMLWAILGDLLFPGDSASSTAIQPDR